MGKISDAIADLFSAYGNRLFKVLNRSRYSGDWCSYIFLIISINLSARFYVACVNS